MLSFCNWLYNKSQGNSQRAHMLFIEALDENHPDAWRLLEDTGMGFHNDGFKAAIKKAFETATEKGPDNAA